jgi:hypothetical protein
MRIAMLTALQKKEMTCPALFEPKIAVRSAKKIGKSTSSIKYCDINLMWSPHSLIYSIR